jgi:hypothetical protein
MATISKGRRTYYTHTYTFCTDARALKWHETLGFFLYAFFHNTQKTVRQKIFTPGISELTVQTGIVRSEIINKYRYKNTAGFFVIPLLDQFWEEKNYCERRNELSQRRTVALPNRHKHLCLFKLGYEVHALLSSIMYKLYILSGKKITAVYPMSRRRWDQNTTQVDNRLDRARATYGRLLHISSMSFTVRFWPDSEATKLLHHPKEKWPVKTTFRGVCL